MGTLTLSSDEFIPVVRINCLTHSRHSINISSISFLPVHSEEANMTEVED